MNVTELRENLISVYEQLRKKEIGVSEAKELANITGKVISSAKAQMEYNKMVGSKSAIKFMIGD